jgi:hypothetical protein
MGSGLAARTHDFGLRPLAESELKIGGDVLVIDARLGFRSVELNRTEAAACVVTTTDATVSNALTVIGTEEP